MSEQVVRGRHEPSTYDVSNHDSVCHMTVWRDLTGDPNIVESMRARVLHPIEEKNRTPSSLVRTLTTMRAIRIGVIIDSAGRAVRTEQHAACTERAARAVGYALSSYSIADDNLTYRRGGDRTGERAEDRSLGEGPREGSDRLRGRGSVHPGGSPALPSRSLRPSDRCRISAPSECVRAGHCPAKWTGRDHER